jgi:hypothetical protein
MARLFLDRIDTHTADIARLDARIEEAMQPLQQPGICWSVSRASPESTLKSSSAVLACGDTPGHNQAKSRPYWM